MPQANKYELLLYADDTCLIFQQSEISEIEILLNKNFSLICDWFVDSKLSIYSGEFLLAAKVRLKKRAP